MTKLMAPLFLLGVAIAVAQISPTESRAYRWADLKVKKTGPRESRAIFSGSTTHMESIIMHSSTVQPGQAPHDSHTHEDLEELVIVKEGKLKVTIKDESKVLGPGSIAFAMPGEEHGFSNAGDGPVTYYIVRFRSKKPMDVARGKEAGGSFMVDFEDLKFTPHDKGGIRRYFNRATAMSRNHEMHVTTLNAGIWSHPVHTHVSEEIILMIKGSAIEQIGDKQHKLTAGDLVFLNSNVPHAIKNDGDEPCMYFAFQWR